MSSAPVRSGRISASCCAGSGTTVVYAPRELDAVEPVDAELALVTVKSYDTAAAIDTLRRALRDSSATTIVTPQNGVGNEEQLSAAFGADNVVAAALTVPVDRDARGKGVASKGGGIAFAPLGSSSSHNWLLAAFGATALPTVAVTDYRALKWSKLALNVVANASCAILDVLPERLVHWDADLPARDPRDSGGSRDDEGAGRRSDRPAALSGAHVAAGRIAAERRRARRCSRRASPAARGEKPPSLLLDLRGAKHRTEVEFLNGAVARAAREAGRGGAREHRVCAHRERHRTHAAAVGEVSGAPGRAPRRGRSERMRHPNVPESLDGWAILHRMFRFDRRAYGGLDATRQATIEREAGALFAELARDADADLGLAQLLGHKGDLMLTHYARTFDALGESQARVDKLALCDYLEPRGSYVSVLELGLYEHTAKIHAELRDRGLKPHSTEWNDAFDVMLGEAAAEPRNAGRLWARIPRRRYACFYPMNKKREGNDNWYSAPYAERARA